ncbi:MAG TPA: MBL fold metallo-hydrolase [Anaerolineales bacterium]|nr:MBL fold metallo-hydrolase [Anaerolineales bacterium]
MQSIAKGVYIEDGYPGVTLGAIPLSHGLIQVDAPPSPEDGRAWRAALLNLGSGSERLLVNLDAHPDRTLGARAMDVTIIAHEKTAQVFRSRPNTFKAQGEETGADWESIPGLGNIRWLLPEITFSSQMTIHWSEAPVLLEHHPGPSAGAVWVVLPEVKVVFIGDAVLRNQPPFLAGADLPVWLETLKLLASPAYKGWSVVSGRGGLVNAEMIKNQKDYLEQVFNKVEKLAQKKAAPESIEGLVTPLLNPFKIPASRHQKYAQRLRYGLYHYYARHYHPSSNVSGEE